MRGFKKDIWKCLAIFVILAVTAAYGWNMAGPQDATRTVSTATWADATGTNTAESVRTVRESGTDEGMYVSGSASSPSGTDTALDIPDYTGTPYVVVNGNVPYFTDADLTTAAFETYSDLDSLGRCGVAYANIGQEIMPTEERGKIGSVKPSGWHTVKYNGLVDGNYLYNRCHLIGYQLAGENANEKNLITGTRYLNVDGMLPFENLVDDYVEETENHVLYRVTPVFEGDNLVASGVLMEALSVEDNGEGICYNVYCYNVQPGIGIDYATGDSWLDEAGSKAAQSGSTKVDQDSNVDGGREEITYVLNINTMRFHYPDCDSAVGMKAKNKQEYTGSRDELIAEGYEPCGACKP